MPKTTGDIKYPLKKPGSLKKMPDGNPFPYEQGEQADGGVTEPQGVESKEGKPKYNPKPLSNEGDRGAGGHS